MKQTMLLVFLGLFVCLPVGLSAQWSDNPNVNTPISTVVYDQIDAKIVSDGAGGAIITWRDYRNGTNYDIYAQRINAAGVAQWTANGVAISAAAHDQSFPTIVRDGAGGAIIAWQDFRSVSLNSDIYAQRVNAAGVVQWTANGVAISTAAGDQEPPTIVSDGGGGAIITWADPRSFGTSNFDIYAQRVNAAGVVQWTADGVAISTAGGNQSGPTIASDNAGGAIITWHDFRNGTDNDIYAQRINGTGVVQWTAGPGGGGVSISTAANDQSSPRILSDGAGGGIITWSDYRNGIDADIYAQRINVAGVVQWTPSGVEISTAAQAQYAPSIESDGAGGAIITWEDFRSIQYHIYAQRIDAAGGVRWTANGVAISTVAGPERLPTIVSDGTGGAIITWTDERNSNLDIYAQRINASGAAQWTANGLAISTAAKFKFAPNIVSDGAGGAVIAWYGFRSGSADIYAQNITGIGLLGDGAVKIQTVKDVKNDQGGKVNVFWNASPYDVFGDYNPIFSYSVFRGMRPSSASANAVTVTSNQYLSMKKQGTLTSNHYMKGFSTMSVTDTIYWQWIDDVTARKLGNYVYAVPTLADSTPQGTSSEYFMVASNLYNQDSWLSSPDSGYSVDNLSPIPPAGLVAAVQAGPQVKLTWNSPTDPDVKSYAIYRSTTSGFIPGPGNAIGTSISTTFTDDNPDSGAPSYYRIIAKDVHDNLSLPSQEVTAAATVTLSISMQPTWNMVSVPLTVGDYSKTALFPYAVSSAFAYEHGYVGYGTLESGRGYWVKFSTAQSVPMTGLLRTSDTVNVSSGWNMIGSLSTSIPVSSIGSIPGGIVTSSFFGYNGSAYFIASNILPGSGYWVKASQAGKLILASTGNTPSAGRIRIEDTSEQPPSAPDGVGSVVPVAYGLEQNFPNPFNPQTTVTFALPASGHVRLSVYNMLGQEVAMLVDEIQDAGYKSVSFNAGGLPSGMYTYRITAGTFTDVKKMVLLK